MNYLDTKTLPIKDDYLSWQKQGLQQTQSGYGSKLSTTKKIMYNNKWHRVYAICYSNCSSCYIISKGEKLFIK